MPALLALEDRDRFIPLNLARDSASMWSNFGVILTSAIACSLMLNGTDPVRPPGWILFHATIPTGFCYSLWKIRILSYFSSWTRICFVICHWAKKTLYSMNKSKTSGSLLSHLGKSENATPICLFLVFILFLRLKYNQIISPFPFIPPKHFTYPFYSLINEWTFSLIDVMYIYMYMYVLFYIYMCEYALLYIYL